MKLELPTNAHIIVTEFDTSDYTRKVNQKNRFFNLSSPLVWETYLMSDISKQQAIELAKSRDRYGRWVICKLVPVAWSEE